jgi:hypothetical protein
MPTINGLQVPHIFNLVTRNYLKTTELCPNGSHGVMIDRRPGAIRSEVRTALLDNSRNGLIVA